MKKNKSLTPGELVKMHINDKTHIITDEDLANVKVGEGGEDKVWVDKEIADKKEELNALKSEIPSSYDVLDI